MDVNLFSALALALCYLRLDAFIKRTKKHLLCIGKRNLNVTVSKLFNRQDCLETQLVVNTYLSKSPIIAIDGNHLQFTEIKKNPIQCHQYVIRIK